MRSTNPTNAFQMFVFLCLCATTDQWSHENIASKKRNAKYFIWKFTASPFGIARFICINAHSDGRFLSLFIPHREIFSEYRLFAIFADLRLGFSLLLINSVHSHPFRQRFASAHWVLVKCSSVCRYSIHTNKTRLTSFSSMFYLFFQTNVRRWRCRICISQY